MSSQKTQMLLAPGERKTVSIPGARAQQLNQMVDQFTPQLAKVLVATEIVAFNDDTTWRHGRMHQRDPHNPRQWWALRDYANTRLHVTPFFQKISFSKSSSSYCVNYAGYGERDCYIPGLCYVVTDLTTPGDEGTITSIWDACLTHYPGGGYECHLSGDYVDFFSAGCP